MKECILCKGEAGTFAHKAYNGAICRKCRSYLPMHIDLKASDTDYLLPLYQRNKELAKCFFTSCQYGELFLDTIHGLFCFSKGNKNGEPVHYGDIFSVTELTEVGIYMDDIRNIGQNTNKIVCNIKMRVKTKDVFSFILYPQLFFVILLSFFPLNLIIYFNIKTTFHKHTLYLFFIHS